MFYSVRWDKLEDDSKSYRGKRKCHSPVIRIQTLFLDEIGRECYKTRLYENWIGVCTDNILKVVHAIEQAFPRKRVSYEKLCHAKKILPYFEQRLERGKLDYRSKPFYKIYTNACHEDVGQLFDVYKIGYFSDADWRVRLYLDLCTRYDTHAFYYKWYEIDPKSSDETSWLLDSYVMRPDRTDSPDWTIGAFDIETVPMNGKLDRVPTGVDPLDTIVMISVVKWNRRLGVKKYLLYLKPRGLNFSKSLLDVRLLNYDTEAQLLVDFHILIRNCQVLTGYNINGFDLPCIFARLLWLRSANVLTGYTSCKLGESIVATYRRKIVLDLYQYFKTFSGYDLTSYKLDDVAKTKLGHTESKVAVKSTGIWTWYTASQDAVASVLEVDRVDFCFDVLAPTHVPQDAFGTFETYLEYCVQDSNLVYLLFRKEDVLSFLVERANFTAASYGAMTALYVGNSRFLLELFQAYGSKLGYFFNSRFFKNPIDETKYSSTFAGKKGKQTYQGALNFCTSGRAYEDVSVMDFTSMYPSALLSSNLCYGTCTVLTREEWLTVENKYPGKLKAIPYRTHDDNDFLTDKFERDQFKYPPVTDEDNFVMVINQTTEAFLPLVVKHFIRLRQHHQKEYKRTRDVYHKNAQLCIKIMINSLYGVMANKDSILSYTVIAMTIVTLSRYQLLGSFHYVKRMGFEACYADTDSLMVHRWPIDNCDSVNRYLNIPGVELKYEQRMKRLIVLSKKRYIYETSEDDQIVTKGFQKKVNDVVKFISDTIVFGMWKATFDRYLPLQNDSMAWTRLFLEENISLESKGWCLWVNTLLYVQYMCFDPKRYAIYRHAKSLDKYKSRKCPAARYLEKYPHKTKDYIEYTYSRADVSKCEACRWVLDPEDCQWVDWEKLFISQKKTFVSCLHTAFFRDMSEKIVDERVDYVRNSIRWKSFVHAELKHEKPLVIAVRRQTTYTFKPNHHLNNLDANGNKRKQVKMLEDYEQNLKRDRKRKSSMVEFICEIARRKGIYYSSSSESEDEMELDDFEILNRANEMFMNFNKLAVTF